MMLRSLILAWLALAWITRANDGNEVVVVFNSKMPASKALAEYYAEKREVPANQLIGLPLQMVGGGIREGLAIARLREIQTAAQPA